MDIDHSVVDQRVATGTLPRANDVAQLVQDSYNHALPHREGEVASYIPELANANPESLAVVAAQVDGVVHAVGDAATEFSIQSISKAFVYALACHALGHGVVRDAVGVNNTGLPFNSVMAIELNDGHPMNSMVNAGAIATTAMIPGQTEAVRWDHIRSGLSDFAGRELHIDDEVYRSESATNQHNQALGRLLQSYGKLQRDPLESVDVYTRQCSLALTASDLAVMGSTLANGGVNPVTKDQVVSAEVCRDVLAIMATTGMYQRSGEWLFEIGLPAKSGVAGGIVAVAPGKGGIATFSPRLDHAGNSVRGIHATSYLSKALALNLFASQPYVD
ncbi:glutaminase A [Demequina aurantiaca]|uniref:glutaminase A n=1 Tax=Demequina aurantiaca TaxID=676200 RepID=UPI003D342592